MLAGRRRRARCSERPFVVSAVVSASVPSLLLSSAGAGLLAGAASCAAVQGGLLTSLLTRRQAAALANTAPQRGLAGHHGTAPPMAPLTVPSPGSGHRSGPDGCVSGRKARLPYRLWRRARLDRRRLPAEFRCAGGRAGRRRIAHRRSGTGAAGGPGVPVGGDHAAGSLG